MRLGICTQIYCDEAGIQIKLWHYAEEITWTSQETATEVTEEADVVEDTENAEKTRDTGYPEDTHDSEDARVTGDATDTEDAWDVGRAKVTRDAG